MRLTPLRTGLFAALLALLGAGAWLYLDQQRSTPVALATLSPEDWRDDLHALADGLVRRHANAFHRISRESFAAMVAATDSAIPGLRPWEVLVRFAELAGAVGDAHTYVAFPANQHFYPFGVYYFGDTARVTRTVPGQEDLLGARLVRVDSAGLGAVEAALDRVLTQGENRSFYRAHYPWFLSVELLYALGVVRDTAAAAFTFQREDGTTVTRVYAPLAAEPADWRRPYAHAPLAAVHGDEDFWFDTLPGGRTLYLVFNGYRDLATNSRRFFDFLDHHPIDRVVVDLRGNGGGDYKEGHDLLIAPLVARPAIDAPGHLFVLVGRATFSAAMNNAAQFRTETRAILVGEAPGEVPNSYQERRDFRLPHSHLAVNYSTAFYRFTPTDVPELVPDHAAPPTWEAYRDGRDPALSWILSDSSASGTP